MKKSASSRKPVVLAAAAHPDDIEFGMAGTLLLLKRSGAVIHMWNLANGSCGTDSLSPPRIARIRQQEAHDSAKLAGAVFHPPLVNDFGLFFEPKLMSRVAAVIREIRPDILLLPSPQDYMEDHQNACRLLAAAAFVRGMRNFKTRPSRPAWGGETVLYHCMPHQLRDSLRQLVRAGQYVDVGPVLGQKTDMLAKHRTQKVWLDKNQGMDSYLDEMKNMARKVGQMSGRFEFAEGWRRHNHLGYSAADRDPMSVILKNRCWTDRAYEESLDE